jgi:hypothetical protein
MRCYQNAESRGPPPRLHPLLLSLCLECNSNPSGFVSEDNEKVLGDGLYVSPEHFPPLDVHLSKNNSAFSAPDPDGFTNASTANYQECMLCEPRRTTGNNRGKRHRRMSSSSVKSPKTDKKRNRRISSGSNPSPSADPEITGDDEKVLRKLL